MRKILNFALFQAGWFACVLGGAHDMPVAAVAAAGAVIGLNLWWFSADRASDLRLLLAVALIGFSVDTVNLWLGVFSLFGAPRFPRYCPVWLTALWAMFGTTLLGAVARPVSYLGGAKLGAVTMNPNRAFSIAALAAGWAVVMPLLVWLAHGTRFRTGIPQRPG
jgi:hypothetical protein